jgi:hypothetical protein
MANPVDTMGQNPLSAKAQGRLTRAAGLRAGGTEAFGRAQRFNPPNMKGGL